jgi:hypothetical protein
LFVLIYSFHDDPASAGGSLALAHTSSITSPLIAEGVYYYQQKYHGLSGVPAAGMHHPDKML